MRYDDKLNPEVAWFQPAAPVGSSLLLCQLTTLAVAAAPASGRGLTLDMPYSLTYRDRWLSTI
jgi:hypothetical protein